MPLGDYFSKGNARLHAIGILGGAIWNVGMSFSIVASTAAGPALSYGLGQGATMVGAFWGVFIWKEFQKAPRGNESVAGGHVCILPARLGNSHRIETSSIRATQCTHGAQP